MTRRVSWFRSPGLFSFTKFSKKHRGDKSSSATRRKRRVFFESLEDRRVLAAVTVDWEQEFGTTKVYTDQVRGIAVDGSVYVAGSAERLFGQTALGNSDIFLRKYQPDGTEVWTRQVGGSHIDNANALVIDGVGNVYVAGESGRAYIHKFDATGNTLWTWSSSGPNAEYVTAAALDASDNLYVAGTFAGYPGIRRFASDGTEVWLSQFGTPFPNLTGITVDASGVYVTGSTSGSLPGLPNLGASDSFVRKYDTSGTELWTRQVATSGHDNGYALSADGLGNIYVGGETRGAFPGQVNDSGADSFIRKYDSDGNELWTRQSGLFSDARAIVAGPTGVVATGGFFSGAAWAYDAAGNLVWNYRIPSTAPFTPWALAVEGTSVYVAGQTFYSADSFDQQVRIVKLALPDNDADGIDAFQEDGAPNGGDGNNDGTPDSAQQNVASLRNGEDARYVTLATPAGTTLAQVSAIANPSPADAPAGVDFPVGFLNFGVQGIANGAATTVTIVLPAGVTANTYFKYGPTHENPQPHWYEFLFDGTTGAETTAQNPLIPSNQVVVHFIDNLRGDDDPQDGTIVDPGSPGLLPNTAPTAIDLDSASVAENLSLGTVVGRFSTTDVDVDDSHTYSFVTGQPLFTIDGSTLKTAAVFDAELEDSYSIEIRTTDEGGLFTDQTFEISIIDVNEAPAVSAALTSTTHEDAASYVADLLTGASDPDSTDVLNVSGLALDSGDASGVTPSGNGLTIDPAAYNHLAVGEQEVIVYSYRVVDGNGGSVSQTATITIEGRNDQPTVSAALTSTTHEDAASYVADLLTGASDPDSTDVLNVSGLALDSGDASGVTPSGNGLTIDPAAYNHLAVGEQEVIVYSYRVVDGDGGSVSQTATITIEGRNDQPTVSAAGPNSGVRGQVRTFTFSATDPTVADVAAGFTYQINWGDGTPVQAVPASPGNGSGVALDHVFATSGTYTVSVTAIDQNGEASDAATRLATISALSLETDPLAPGQTMLIVGGTTAADSIEFKSADGGASVEVMLNGASLGVFHPTGRLIAIGQAGDDEIQVSGSIGLPAWLYGEGGDDRLKGGAGNDGLMGGAGDDLLVGHSGRDLLIGGTGADRIVGNSDDDILIAGSTTHDDHASALAAIMDEWTSSRSYSQRIANISNRTIEGSDGSTFTSRRNADSFLIVDATVLDDNTFDVLTGSAGLDWFFFNADGDEGTSKDKVTDLHANEFAGDLDWIEEGI